MERITSDQLKHYDFFEGLSDGALEALSVKVVRKEFPAGTEIIREGERGDAFYILCKGEVEITKKTEFGVSARVASAHSGESFGEQALLTNLPRSCTVTAKTDITLSMINKDDFDAILSLDTAFSNMLERKSRSYAEFNRLKTLQPLALIEPEKMLALIENMTSRTFVCLRRDDY